MKFPTAFRLVLAALPLRAEDWPQWRGPRLDGTSTEREMPTRWSATENILWKTLLPGGGHASPIISGDHIFTVAALEDTEERQLLCLDRQDGAIRWRTTVI